MERLLDTVDAVIYILDYTKLKTQEEADLLSKLKVGPVLCAEALHVHCLGSLGLQVSCTMQSMVVPTWDSGLWEFLLFPICITSLVSNMS